MEYIQNKSSACVEILRSLSHDVATYFQVTDPHRSHRDVNIEGDLEALLIDLKEQNVHSCKGERRVPPPRIKRRRGTRQVRKTKVTSGVHDVLTQGRKALSSGGLFAKWLARTLDDDADNENDGIMDETLDTGTAFDAPDGTMDVDAEDDAEYDPVEETDQDDRQDV